MEFSGVFLLEMGMLEKNTGWQLMNQQLNNLLEVGEIVLEDGISGHHILFLSIIGEIEGHNLSSERIKTTKYEHLLPILAKAQDSEEIEGIFFLINTVGARLFLWSCCSRDDCFYKETNRFSNYW